MRMKFIGIIPARYASTRFPGKPLAILGGKTMIQRVYEQASRVLDDVIVATDDDRIYQTVQAFGGQVVMTRADHRCGTERCLEAIQKIGGNDNENENENENDNDNDNENENENDNGNENENENVIINIQGDEPFIQPEQIHAVMECFDKPCDIATLVKPFKPEDGLGALENPNSPKVVFNSKHEAILFSRSVIPYLRGVDKSEWLSQHTYYKHIGLYAYRAEVLEQITKLPCSPLEKAESLEQLRWLEAGYKIRVAETHTETIGIDTPEDLAKAEAFLNETNKKK